VYLLSDSVVLLKGNNFCKNRVVREMVGHFGVEEINSFLATIHLNEYRIPPTFVDMESMWKSGVWARSVFDVTLLIALSGCGSGDTMDVPLSHPGALPEIQKPRANDTILLEMEKSIVVLPCANGYDFSTSNMDLDKEIVESMKLCGFTLAQRVSFKKLQGVNVYGLWHEKDLDQIRSTLTQDYFVVCRMHAPDGWEINRQSTNEWGYSLRLYDRRSGKLKGQLSTKDLAGFEYIKGDMATHCEELHAFTKN
jgi:hypothetical protein